MSIKKNYLDDKIGYGASGKYMLFEMDYCTIVLPYICLSTHYNRKRNYDTKYQGTHESDKKSYKKSIRLKCIPTNRSQNNAKQR